MSTLSKVEHDRLTLTYDKLLQVSQRLNIPVSDLFADPAGKSGAELAVTARRSIGNLASAVRVNTKNYFYVCPELRRKRMIPIVVKIRTKSLEEFGDLVRHSGEEYVFVLEGGIAVHTEFYDPVMLKSGESIYVDSNMGHAYIAEKCDEATVLAICSSTDERLMESLMSLHGDATMESKPEPKRLIKPVKRQKR